MASMYAVKLQQTQVRHNYNYKGFHRMVLLAVCDTNYCFSLVGIG